MSNLIVYFSREGNNYVNGTVKNLKIGNTEIIGGEQCLCAFLRSLNILISTEKLFAHSALTKAAEWGTVNRI